MTSSDKVTFGLALTIMEVQRLARNGVLRIGDRIRQLNDAKDIAEIVDLAPDLGEAQEDYLLAILAAGAFPTQPSFGLDRPHLRLLGRSDVACFHLLRRDARDLLEDRARDFGIELVDPLWDSGFDSWQKKTRARVLDIHATRLRMEFRLPSPDVAQLNLIERAMAMANTVEVTHSLGTPAYGWAVVFRSIWDDKALKDDPALKERVGASLKDLRARPFAGDKFFDVYGSEAAALAKDLRRKPDAEKSAPSEGMAWLNQIGHQHFRGAPPTAEAFNRSLTWLAQVIGLEWAASCLEVYCNGAVRLDARASMAWPMAADLACFSGTIIVRTKLDVEAKPEELALLPLDVSNEKADAEPSPSQPISDEVLENPSSETEGQVSLQDSTTNGAAEALRPTPVETIEPDPRAELTNDEVAEKQVAKVQDDDPLQHKTADGVAEDTIPTSAEATAPYLLQPEFGNDAVSEDKVSETQAEAPIQEKTTDEDKRAVLPAYFEETSCDRKADTE
jgi:hypothetical protein